jgi:hypoxanthine phosphoribosyltransferase
LSWQLWEEGGRRLGVLIPQERIRARVRTLGEEVSRTAESAPLLVVVILKGAFVFAADLVRSLTIPAEVDFMAVQSYGAATKSSGEVRIVKDLDRPLDGRDVLIVEDIVDTGLTLRYLQRTLAQRRPRSLRTCVLLDKYERRQVEVPVEYTGFRIPDRFVVGYGLDVGERHRQHPDLLYVAEPGTELGPLEVEEP